MLAHLINERDVILERLELAETRYISSFQISTPEPSMADLSVNDFRPPPPVPPKSDRPYISGPRPLVSNVSLAFMPWYLIHTWQNFKASSRGRRRPNPVFGISSLGGSFVAPSQYYRLRGVNASRRLTLSSFDNQPTLADSINQRVVGSRFQEVTRGDSRQALGRSVVVDENGELGPSSRRYSIIYGPNHAFNGGDIGSTDLHPLPEIPDSSDGKSKDLPRTPGQETSDVADMSTSSLQEPAAGPSNWQQQSMEPVNLPAGRGPRIFMAQAARATPTSSRRETFPRRRTDDEETEKTGFLAPHLRLQHQQPCSFLFNFFCKYVANFDYFTVVRPASGLDLDMLGDVYAEINEWRSKLKTINSEIAEAQQAAYIDIGEGAPGVKGWLLVGRGLRYIPGVEIIEGRSKDDVRWDVLQHERTVLDTLVLYTIVIIVALLLALGGKKQCSVSSSMGLTAALISARGSWTSSCN